MTEAEIKKFASDYAPKLAEDITKLCGSVIAKGLQGILEQCAEMQLRINELEATLIAHGIPIYGESGPNELGHRPETAGGRHGSGGQTGSAPCGPERNSNMDEILKLREELERERMRLAACGVVALANTPDSAEKARTMHDDYRSASCDDVARAVDRQMALHNALTAVMSYPGVRDYLGGQVSEIADSALMGPNVK